MMIETRIQGIPCLVEVLEYEVHKPCFTADNDLDYRGYTVCEFEVFDRKGYKAPWLELKMTERDEENILETIKEAYAESF